MQPPSKKYAQKKMDHVPQKFWGEKMCVKPLFVPTTVLEPKWPFPIKTRVIWVLGTCWCFWCFLFTSKVPRQEEASTKTKPKTSMMQNVPRERHRQGGRQVWKKLAPVFQQRETNDSPTKWGMVWKIWVFPKIVVPPKSSILIGFSIIFTIHFAGTLIFGNTHHQKNVYKNSGCSERISSYDVFFLKDFDVFFPSSSNACYLSDTFKFHTLPGPKKWEASNLIGFMYGMFTYEIP